MEKEQRFIELSGKIKSLGRGGYMKLSTEEKEEYQSLKEELDGSVEAQEEQPKESDTVARLIEMNEILNKRLSALEKEKAETQAGVEGEDMAWHEKKDKISKRTAQLVKWRPNVDSEWMVAINRRLHSQKYNESKRMIEDIYKIMFLKEDGETIEVEMPLLQYAQIKTFVTVVLEKEYRRELRKKTGTTTARMSYDYANFRGTRTRDVDVYVERVERSFDALLPDGRTVKVHEKVLNGS